MEECLSFLFLNVQRKNPAAAAAGFWCGIWECGSYSPSSSCMAWSVLMRAGMTCFLRETTPGSVAMPSTGFTSKARETMASVFGPE